MRDSAAPWTPLLRSTGLEGDCVGCNRLGLIPTWQQGEDNSGMCQLVGKKHWAGFSRQEEALAHCLKLGHHSAIVCEPEGGGSG